MDLLKYLIYIIFSYCIGSILFAIIITKLMHLNDPRNYGSHNAGATNVMRSGNKIAGASTFLGDFLKGLLIIILAKVIFYDSNNFDLIVCLSAVFVILGHILPIFFNFKGGKGVATFLGVLFGFHYLVGLMTCLTWLLVFLFFRISALSAIVAIFLSPLYIWMILHNILYCFITSMMAILIILKHKSNILSILSKISHK